MGGGCCWRCFLGDSLLLPSENDDRTPARLCEGSWIKEREEEEGAEKLQHAAQYCCISGTQEEAALCAEGLSLIHAEVTVAAVVVDCRCLVNTHLSLKRGLSLLLNTLVYAVFLLPSEWACQEKCIVRTHTNSIRLYSSHYELYIGL